MGAATATTAAAATATAVAATVAATVATVAATAVAATVAVILDRILRVHREGGSEVPHTGPEPRRQSGGVRGVASVHVVSTAADTAGAVDGEHGQRRRSVAVIKDPVYVVDVVVGGRGAAAH
jgi:hypothetical protein